MSLRVLDLLLDEMVDAGCQCLIIALAVAVHLNVSVLESGFVAVEGYLFDLAVQVLQLAVGVDLEELQELSLF
jgi:hypothetical protein